MKKSWTYSKYQTTYTVVLDTDLNLIETSYNKYKSSYTAKEWLVGDYIKFPLAIENELMELVINNLQKEDLSPLEKQHYKFWQYLDKAKLPSSTRFENIKVYKHWQDEFIEVRPIGVSYIYIHHDGTEQESDTQRLDHLFFGGPKQPLALESRRAVRAILLAALAPESGLSSKDLFPLFDYSKLPHKRYEHSENNGYSGEWWALEGTHISRGGWDRQGRDGGGQHYSIEAAYPKLNGLSGVFEPHRAEILACLEAAIL